MHPKGDEGGPSYQSALDVIKLWLSDDKKKKVDPKQMSQSEDDRDEKEKGR